MSEEPIGTTDPAVTQAGPATAAPVTPAGADNRGKAPPGTVFLRSNAEVGDYLDAYANAVVDATRINRCSEAQWRQTHAHDGDVLLFERAHRLGLPLIELDAIEPDPNALDLVPPSIVRRFQFVPTMMRAGVLGIAVSDPADAQILPTMNFLTDRRIALMVAEPQQVRAAIAKHYDHVEDAAIARQLGLDSTRAEGESSEQEAQRLALEQPIVRIVGDMFADASRRRASDIHLRPGEDGVDLLFRIDNELVPVRSFLRALQRALVSRIKVLGSMNVAEHRVPQDGRATYLADDGHAIDLRISILPTIHGESVVIRLLDTLAGLRSIGQLGFSAGDETRFLDMMTRSHGMILVTGPTGSGKSTTLYAALLEARKERVNIITVEDPVEYHIDEVQQMQVNRAAGFTFAAALRNILRHDPDVIMVGEIRDRETAQIAVESALTGHLLLSTLHTNTAATTITRLLDLGVEAFLLRSTLLGVLSQRLTRRNCPHCLAPESVPAHWREALQVAAEEVFYRGSGCSRCDGLGVRGRLAVYELMTISPAIRRLIQPHCEADVIHEVALSEGMVSITRNAVALARSGVISFAEAFRLRAD